MLSRRELLAGSVGVSLAAAAQSPASPVAIAKCEGFSGDMTAPLQSLFDHLGGIEKLVRNKTVTIKLNLTGSPALRFQGKALGLTHYTHPKMAGALAHLLGQAGAKRIRFVESCNATGGPMEDYLLDSGWNVRQLQNAAPNVEFENTNAKGKIGHYTEFRVPGGGTIFPSYVMNRAYLDTDVFISMAKLKDHATCGVTLSMKNCFGNTPASIYGDDAGLDEPNEAPTKGRVKVCHFGERQPARVAPAEKDSNSSRDPGYRMPRITADLCAARPIDLAIIDGIETVTGGEGPWIKGLALAKPGVLLAGFNAVCTDAVGAAVMGYDPRALKGSAPFEKCDNTLVLAEAMGLGSADLKRIEVRGPSIAEVAYRFR